MHTTNELLDEIGRRRGNSTTYHLAKALETSQQTVTHWRKGRSVMSSDFAPRVAALLDWDPAYVMACVEHERVQRAQSDPLEQTGEILATWARIAEKFRPTLPGILLALLAAAGGLKGEPAEAVTAAGANFSALPLYTLCAIRTELNRRRRRKKKPAPSPPPPPPAEPKKRRFLGTFFPILDLHPLAV